MDIRAKTPEIGIFEKRRHAIRTGAIWEIEVKHGPQRQPDKSLSSDFTKYQEEACSDNTGIPSSYNDTIFQDKERTSVPINPEAIWSEMSKRPIGEMAADAGYIKDITLCNRTSRESRVLIARPKRF